MTSDAPGVLRNEDYTLSSEQEALRDAYRSFFEKRCTTSRVRDAEPLGFDPELWAELAELRPVALAVPEAAGGDGGGLVELVLMLEEAGRAAAPAPIVDAVVTARLLARIDGEVAATALARLLAGELATITFLQPGESSLVLTGAGAVAPIVVGWVDGDLVLSEAVPEREVLPNLASAPIAWRALDGVVLASGKEAGELWSSARLDWELAMGAALVGLGESAVQLGVQYAKDRTAFGVPIGTFQAIAHPLVDVTIAVTSARRLLWKAAWFAENEPDALGALATMAYVHAGEAAERAGAVSIHTQGGFGFTLESDVQLFYRRAKGWPLLAGDRHRELLRIADLLYGPVA